MEDILLQEIAQVTQIAMARLRLALPRTLDYKRKNVNKQISQLLFLFKNIRYISKRSISFIIDPPFYKRYEDFIIKIEAEMK